MITNIAPQILSASGDTYSFDASLVIDDQSVAISVVIDDQGLRISTKKDEVYFPRADWLDVSMVDHTLAFIVHGIQHADWAKKRKFEKKNPGEDFVDFTPAASSYVFTFKPKKLPEGTTPAILNDQVKRTYVLAYLDEVDDPTLIRCNDCNKMMDVTPYGPDDSLFCENCSRVMGQTDEPNHGICNGCGYYTKLVKQKSAESGQEIINVERTCHRCRVSDAFRGFIYGVLAAVGVGILNYLTITFANRFFPALIVIAVIALIWGVFKFVLMIVYSMARKAAGETPLENATNALRKGKTDDALQIINEMDGDMTQNPGILLNLTRGLINSKNYEKAGQFAEMMTDSFPNFSQGYEGAIAVHALQGNVPESERILEDLTAVTARNQVRSVRRQKLLNELPA